jgi:predicted nucleic acid-binding protein
VTPGPFFDTSVLLAGLIDLGPSSIPAQHLMTAVADGKLGRVHTAWHCCLEFYAVATRLPEELRLHPRDVWRLIDEELFGRFAVHQLPADHQRSFLGAIAEERIVGGRIYDAHIAEIARQARVGVVVTDNVRHFTGLVKQGVRVVSAADFAHEVTS